MGRKTSKKKNWSFYTQYQYNSVYTSKRIRNNSSGINILEIVVMCKFKMPIKMFINHKELENFFLKIFQKYIRTIYVPTIIYVYFELFYVMNKSIVYTEC